MLEGKEAERQARWQEALQKASASLAQKKKKDDETCDRLLREVWRCAPEFDPRRNCRRIYFAQSFYGGPVKIGTTYSLERRLRQLNVASSQPLCILATMSGWRKEEAELHQRFGAAHVHSEWYEPVPELMRLVWAQESARPHVEWPFEVNEGICHLLPPFVRVVEPHEDPDYVWIHWKHTPEATAGEIEAYLDFIGYGRASLDPFCALRWLEHYIKSSSPPLGLNRPVGTLLQEVCGA